MPDQHRRPKPKRKPRRRPYHLLDDERMAFDEHENPDWLIGAY